MLVIYGLDLSGELGGIILGTWSFSYNNDPIHICHTWHEGTDTMTHITLLEPPSQHTMG